MKTEEEINKAIELIRKEIDTMVNSGPESEAEYDKYMAKLDYLRGSLRSLVFIISETEDVNNYVSLRGK